MSVSIYALTDPVNGAVRYVGKTSGSMRTRLLAHLNDVRRGRTYIPRHRWIADLAAKGQSPVIVLLETVHDEQWQVAEMGWIARMKADGADLLNATAGGDGLARYSHRADTKQKQSESAKERYRRQGEREKTGASVSAAFQRPEVKEKQRAAAAGFTNEHKARFQSGSLHYARTIGREVTRARFTGRAISAEAREALSVARTGIGRSPESIEKQRQTIKGRKLSEAHKAAILAGRKRYFDARRAEANR